MIDPKDAEWVEGMMTHPDWPKMEALLFGDAQQLLGMSLVVRTECSAGVQSALKKCGLDVPQNQEEQLRTYLALRAVVGYLTEKKKQLDKMRQMYKDNVRQGVANGHLTPEPQTTLRGN